MLLAITVGILGLICFNIFWHIGKMFTMDLIKKRYTDLKTKIIFTIIAIFTFLFAIGIIIITIRRVYDILGFSL